MTDPQKPADKANAAKPVRPSTKEEHAAIYAAVQRGKSRGPRLAAKLDPQNGRATSPHADKSGWMFQMEDAFGTTSPDFTVAEISRIVATVSGTDKSTDECEMNALLATMDGADPKDEIEAMLVSQMIVTHRHAMTQLRKAAGSQYVESLAAHGNLATKLQRTFIAQVEALAKLRRGGEQTVRVEHVHVHAGAQAIVGNVQTGGGASLETRGQTHDATDPRALAFAPGSPVWSPEPTGETVPDGSGEGQETLPPARRR